MSTVKLAQGARTALTTTALNSLPSGTYVVVGTITHNSGGKAPLDCLVEVFATPGPVAGNKQIVVFAQPSLDGTNFGTGPVSGTNAADEPDLVFIGTVPVNTNATLQRRMFSLAAAFGGVLPFATKLVIKNDSGAALAASGHGVYTMDVTGDAS